MNLLNLFWKHKEKGQVIKYTCLKKLPTLHHASYYQTVEQPTHYYDDNSGLLTGILVGEMLSDNSISTVPDSSPTIQDDTPKFDGFGDGDFGGGGSSDSFASNSDSSSSYDSGSSSYDSGSSSFDSSSY